MRLTDLSIRALGAPTDGAIVFWDDVLPGFGVRVSKGGTKSYVLTHGVRRQRETIGRIGVVTLQEARTEAKRRLAEYTLGKDKPQSITWDDARDEFLKRVAARCKKRTHHDYTYHLQRHFKFGRTKLGEVSSHELQQCLDRLAYAPAIRRYAYVVLRAFMRWAYLKHYIASNPVERIDVPCKSPARERTLTDDELRRVWLTAGNDTFGRIAKLLILTGQRRGEITELKSTMIGSTTITFPSVHTKNKRQHTFPVGALARELIGGPYDTNEFVFRGLGRKTPFNGHSPCKRRLDKRCGVEGWTLHDLRRTFATGLASLGVQIPVIERLLNHISGSFGGIVGVYQRYDFMPEMREAITKWELHIQKLLTSD
jgi:integrase